MISAYCDRCPTFRLPAVHPEALDGHPDNKYSSRNPFSQKTHQTKQGSRPSCPDQEGRKGAEEGVPENLGVPLEGDWDVGEQCGSHQGCQVAFRPPIPHVGLLLRRCSRKGLHLAMRGESRCCSGAEAPVCGFKQERRRCQ